MSQKIGTPLEQRKTRIQHLMDIYTNNKDKSSAELEKLFTDYLSAQYLSAKKIREYLDLMFLTVVNKK